MGDCNLDWRLIGLDWRRVDISGVNLKICFRYKKVNFNDWHELTRIAGLAVCIKIGDGSVDRCCIDWPRICFGLSGWSESGQRGLLVKDCHPKWRIGIKLVLDWQICQRLAFPGIGVWFTLGCQLWCHLSGAKLYGQSYGWSSLAETSLSSYSASSLN